MRKRLQVRAVWDSDLEKLLKSLGVLDELIAGELRCDVCGCEVDLDNLGAIFSQDGEVRVSCDDTRCVRVVTKREVSSASG